MPSVAKKISEVILDGRVLDFVDKREFSKRRYGSNAYTVYSYGGVQYVFLPYSDESGSVVTVHYVEENFIPTNDSDILDIEDDYFSLLSLYACWNLCRDREDDRYELFRRDYETLFKKYKAFLRTTFGINTRIPTSAFGAFRNPR